MKIIILFWGLLISCANASTDLKCPVHQFLSSDGVCSNCTACDVNGRGVTIRPCSAKADTLCSIKDSNPNFKLKALPQNNDDDDDEDDDDEAVSTINRSPPHHLTNHIINKEDSNLKLLKNQNNSASGGYKQYKNTSILALWKTPRAELNGSNIVATTVSYNSNVANDKNKFPKTVGSNTTENFFSVLYQQQLSLDVRDDKNNKQKLSKKLKKKVSSTQSALLLMPTVVMADPDFGDKINKSIGLGHQNKTSLLSSEDKNVTLIIKNLETAFGKSQPQDKNNKHIKKDLSMLGKNNSTNKKFNLELEKHSPAVKLQSSLSASTNNPNYMYPVEVDILSKNMSLPGVIQMDNGTDTISNDSKYTIIDGVQVQGGSYLDDYSSATAESEDNKFYNGEDEDEEDDDEEDEEVQFSIEDKLNIAKNNNLTFSRKTDNNNNYPPTFASDNVNNERKYEEDDDKDNDDDDEEEEEDDDDDDDEEDDGDDDDDEVNEDDDGPDGNIVGIDTNKEMESMMKEILKKNSSHYDNRHSTEDQDNDSIQSKTGKLLIGNKKQDQLAYDMNLDILKTEEEYVQSTDSVHLVFILTTAVTCWLFFILICIFICLTRRQMPIDYKNSTAALIGNNDDRSSRVNLMQSANYEIEDLNKGKYFVTKLKGGRPCMVRVPLNCKLVKP